MLKDIKKYRRRVWVIVGLLAFGYILDIIFKCHGILALIVALPLNVALIIQFSKLSVSKAEYKETQRHKGKDTEVSISIIDKDEE